MHFARAIAENSLGLPIGHLYGPFTHEDDAGLNIVQDRLLFGKRGLQAVAHLVKLAGQPANFIRLAPTQRTL